MKKNDLSILIPLKKALEAVERGNRKEALEHTKTAMRLLDNKK